MILKNSKNLFDMAQSNLDKKNTNRQTEDK